MAHSQDTSTLACSFCGKHRREVRKLISGPKVFICDECVSLCNDIIGETDETVPGIAALRAMSLLDFLKLRCNGRAVDSITLGELRAAIQTEWGRRLPEPTTAPHLPPPPSDPELEQLATRYGVPAIGLIDAYSLTGFRPEVLALIDGDFARRHRVIPWGIADRPNRTLIVAMADPSDTDAIAALELATALPIAPVVAVEKLLILRIERYYPRTMTAKRAAALRDAKERIDRGERVQDVLPTLHDIPERDLTLFLAGQFGVPPMDDLDSLEVAPEVTALIDEAFQRRSVFVPVSLEGPYLTIAMANPSDRSTIKDVARIMERIMAREVFIGVRVASEAAICRKIDQHFPRTH